MSTAICLSWSGVTAPRPMRWRKRTSASNGHSVDVACAISRSRSAAAALRLTAALFGLRVGEATGAQQSPLPQRDALPGSDRRDHERGDRVKEAETRGGSDERDQRGGSLSGAHEILDPLSSGRTRVQMLAEVELGVSEPEASTLTHFVVVGPPRPQRCSERLVGSVASFVG